MELAQAASEELPAEAGREQARMSWLEGTSDDDDDGSGEGSSPAADESSPDDGSGGTDGQVPTCCLCGEPRRGAAPLLRACACGGSDPEGGGGLGFEPMQPRLVHLDCVAAQPQRRSPACAACGEDTISPTNAATLRRLLQQRRWGLAVDLVGGNAALRRWLALELAATAAAPAELPLELAAEYGL